MFVALDSPLEGTAAAAGAGGEGGGTSPVLLQPPRGSLSVTLL